MSTYRKKEMLKSQLADTLHMLSVVKEHPFMSIGFKKKADLLKMEIETLPDEVNESKVKLLFSGNAVAGSIGIKSDFISKTMRPFQELIKAQTTIVRFGNIARRGKSKGAMKTELYLTALPTGSFGVELSHLDNNDIFSELDVSHAIKDIMNLIESCSKSDKEFEEVIDKTPKRSLANLNKFLKEISIQNSILKIESGDANIEISENEIQNAFLRVNTTKIDETDEYIIGTLRGIMLESGKFEITKEDGGALHGYVGKHLSDDDLLKYAQDYLNNRCKIHLIYHKTIFKTGKEKTSYELLEISKC
jgi:hypothetical protein